MFEEVGKAQESVTQRDVKGHIPGDSGGQVSGSTAGLSLPEEGPVHGRGSVCCGLVKVWVCDVLRGVRGRGCLGRRERPLASPGAWARREAGSAGVSSARRGFGWAWCSDIWTVAAGLVCRLFGESRSLCRAGAGGHVSSAVQVGFFSGQRWEGGPHGQVAECRAGR